MKTIRLTEVDDRDGDDPTPITINIDRITAWKSLPETGLSRILLDGDWYVMRESPEQITSLVAQARALDLT